MGNVRGFIEYERVDLLSRPVEERLQDFAQVLFPPEAAAAVRQAGRCMDCGIPFCHAGCPLGNLIPAFNEDVSAGRWEDAWRILRRTNNFPEFTGQVCPAPCESACVAGIGGNPVAIEQVEWAVVEEAFQRGFVRPRVPSVRTGNRVAVVGSGPAGLACADQLNSVGHEVVVFERDAQPGGLLRYGIPDFKLEKWVVDRRLDVMRAEGVKFVTGVDVGRDVTEADLDVFDAVVLCTGSRIPRDVPVPGRHLEGILFAMDFLGVQNQVNAGELDLIPEERSARGRHVMVIGGGDTGSDCVGTAHRQGATSVTQLEILPVPPRMRPLDQPWPYMPAVLKTTSSHREGGQRQWSVMTTSFLGTGRVEGVQTVDVHFVDGRMKRIAGSERAWPADLVLLAVGYTGPDRYLTATLGLTLTERGTVAEEGYLAHKRGYFVAGDARRGQSLVVWAIAEGREAALAVDRYLSGGESRLRPIGEGDLPRR